VAGTSQLPICCHTLLALDPAANMSMPFAPVSAAVNATGRFKVRFIPDVVTLANPILIEHELLPSVAATPGVAGEDQAVPASFIRNNWFGALA